MFDVQLLNVADAVEARTPLPPAGSNRPWRSHRRRTDHIAPARDASCDHPAVHSRRERARASAPRSVAPASAEPSSSEVILTRAVRDGVRDAHAQHATFRRIRDREAREPGGGTSLQRRDETILGTERHVAAAPLQANGSVRGTMRSCCPSSVARTCSRPAENARRPLSAHGPCALDRAGGRSRRAR